MNLRMPFVAGMFYESSPSACTRHIERMLHDAGLPDDLPAPLLGGIVPHAGWAYSGALAAKTLKALLWRDGTPTVVFFGADHTGTVRMGEVYDSGVWRTPLGDAAIDEPLARDVLAAGGNCLRPNAQAHAREHSLEVQVPLLQVLAPDARILPIAVPPTDLALDVGRAVAAAAQSSGRGVIIVGSTDLTHHGGPRFPAPGGRGEKGEIWTAGNDRRMIDLMISLDAEAVIAEAEEHLNACGAGAIAATLAAVKALGASRGLCLEYTNSYRITHERYPHELDDTTVGYASVVFA
jgi:hypothetical protein